MLSFLEKPRPEEIDTNLINAGMYVLEPDVLDLIPSGRASRSSGRSSRSSSRSSVVHGVALPGYWLDVGTPDAYLQAHRDVLERNFVTELGDALGGSYTLVADGAEVSPDARLVPPVYVGAGARIDAGARIGSLAVVGAGARRRRPCVDRVLRRRSGRGRRRGHARHRLDPRRARGARRRAARCTASAVVGPGAKVGDRNMLDHGLRVAADEIDRRGALSF